jgi:hypothetical protein
LKAEGKRGLVYPAEGIAEGSRVVLVEGMPCAAAVRSLGYTPIGYGGKAIPDAWWRALVRGCECVLAPDWDEAGIQAASRVEAAIKPAAASVAVARLPGAVFGGMDVADELRRFPEPRVDRIPQASGFTTKWVTVEYPWGRERARQILEDALAGARRIERPPRGRPSDKREEALRYLREALGDHRWNLSEEVEQNRPEGISPRTLDRVRDTPGIEVRRAGRRWEMRLPESHLSG